MIQIIGKQNFKKSFQFLQRIILQSFEEIFMHKKAHLTAGFFYFFVISIKGRYLNLIISKLEISQSLRFFEMTLSI